MATQLKRIKDETIEIVLSEQKPRESFGDCLQRIVSDSLKKCKKKAKARSSKRS